MNYSVVIPAYNAAGTLAEAIDSVLSQSIPPQQVVVVDDGSEDDTGDVAQRFGGPVELLRQTNQGPGVAMSRGMTACRQPWIAGLDADDVWLPHKMADQFAWIGEHPAWSGVFARMQLFGQSIRTPVVQDGWSRSTMVISRSVFAAIGNVVDPPGRRGEMIDWIARAREAGFRLGLIPEVLAMRRVLAGSLSWKRDPLKDRGYLHVARAAMLRKRMQAVGSPHP